MVAEVVVDIACSEMDRVFDYSCFDTVKLGSRVLVPFGKKFIEGYVINLKEKSNFEDDKLKSIVKVIDSEVITDEMLKLLKFMTVKYNLKMIDVIKLFLPSGLRNNTAKQLVLKQAKLTKNYAENLNLIRKGAKNQLLLVDYLKDKQIEKVSILNEKFSNGSVKKLVELGIIEVVEENVYRTPKVYKTEKKNVVMTDLQNKVINSILSSENKTILLHGVTGSGKTEVYMHIIEKMIEKGKTAIMLVPEISLTPQVMQNFVSRFGENVAILHSGLSVGERFDEWQRIKRGEAKIVVGARSAIFAPIQNIGVIIIDEEHDASYFSESNPRYFTHEVAKFRASFYKANLVLGSATPSIDDYFKAQNGEYKLCEMPVRVNHQDMPEVSIVDMQSEIRNGNTTMFSNLLINKLSKTMKNNQQAILFLNRRGFSSFITCRDCGETPKCEDCDVSLVYHKEDNELKCHYCGRRYKVITKCPKCGSSYLRYGAVGTQRVVEELKEHFKDIKIFRLDNDTVSSKNGHEEILREFGNTKPSILVGTQMIAKGHDFPLVSLVGIIDADVSLHFADYRANERTFDLITQVSGRAGRSEIKGEVVLQTYMPRHYVYRYASSYDYSKFYDREINLRKVTNFPPFVSILRVLVSGENEDKVKDATKQIFDRLKELRLDYIDEFIYLNAMKSPVKRIERKYRYQILMRIKNGKYDEIIAKIFEIKQSLKLKNVSVFIEQNPQNLS